MKPFIHYSIICVFLVASFAIVAVNNPRLLTTTERGILQKRIQQQDIRIISSNTAKELHLLKSVSRAIDANAPGTQTLVNQMRKAVAAYEGLGLAAVQIGIPVRVVLLKQTIENKTAFKAYFNPVILHKSSATKEFIEACLSLPMEEYHRVKRAIDIKISYQAEDGHNVIEHLTNLDAAVFQQEIDHLNGVLINDYNLTHKLED